MIDQARGELFKSAHHDDLISRDLLQRCIDALDLHPEAVLAYTWSAAIDSTGTVTHLVDYTTSTSLPRAPERFKTMLFDGWGDDYGGVVRLAALRSIAPLNSYHFADRVFTTELGLYGPFHIIPERLHFRRISWGAGRPPCRHPAEVHSSGPPPRRWSLATSGPTLCGIPFGLLPSYSTSTALCFRAVGVLPDSDGMDRRKGASDSQSDPLAGGNSSLRTNSTTSRRLFRCAASSPGNSRRVLRQENPSAGERPAS